MSHESVLPIPISTSNNTIIPTIGQKVIGGSLRSQSSLKYALANEQIKNRTVKKEVLIVPIRETDPETPNSIMIFSRHSVLVELCLCA
jgi:hypothetical protein